MVTSSKPRKVVYRIPCFSFTFLGRNIFLIKQMIKTEKDGTKPELAAASVSFWSGSPGRCDDRLVAGNAMLTDGHHAEARAFPARPSLSHRPSRSKRLRVGGVI
jgi:hypothetical protein